MREPAIIVSKDIYEKYGLMGIEVLPDIFVVTYLTERQAKADAKFLGVAFARIDTMAFMGLSW